MFGACREANRQTAAPVMNSASRILYTHRFRDDDQRHSKREHLLHDGWYGTLHFIDFVLRGHHADRHNDDQRSQPSPARLPFKARKPPRAYVIASQTAPPNFTPAAGTYVSGQVVTLTDDTSGAVMYYTTGRHDAYPQFLHLLEPDHREQHHDVIKAI